VAGCCECGDEPSGSCAMELVSLVVLGVQYSLYWQAFGTTAKKLLEHPVVLSKLIYNGYRLYSHRTAKLYPRIYLSQKKYIMYVITRSTHPHK
jgi:hypothetical protein